MKEIVALLDYIEKENLWYKEKTFERQEILTHIGDTERYLYYIEEGAMRAYAINEEGDELTVRLAYRENLFTALPSFLLGQASNLCLQCIKRSKVKIIKRQDFLNIIEGNPLFQGFWQQMLIMLFVDQQEREIDILCTRPEERYKRVLERSPQVFQEIPNKYIAAYLRMSAETLSRLKKS